MDAEIDYSRYYLRYHNHSDEHFERMAGYFAHKLANFLPPKMSAHILEIGCGMGFALGGLQRLGYVNLQGIDSDREQVAAAVRRALPVNLVPTANTAAFLQENAGHFDEILIIDVLEHIPFSEQLRFLRAVKLALVPGGLLLCQVPNANSGIGSRYRYNDWTHHCSFTESSLDFVLHNAGFIDITVQEADPNVVPRLPFIPRPAVARWLLRKSLYAIRRLEYVAELGWAARAIPLTPNIMALAKRVA